MQGFVLCSVNFMPMNDSAANQRKWSKVKIEFSCVVVAMIGRIRNRIWTYLCVLCCSLINNQIHTKYRVSDWAFAVVSLFHLAIDRTPSPSPRWWHGSGWSEWNASMHFWMFDIQIGILCVSVCASSVLFSKLAHMDLNTAKRHTHCNCEPNKWRLAHGTIFVGYFMRASRRRHNTVANCSFNESTDKRASILQCEIAHVLCNEQAHCTPKACSITTARHYAIMFIKS